MSVGSVLLVDFGASRIKGVHYHVGDRRVLSSCERPAPVPCAGPAGEVEIDPFLYCTIFNELTSTLCNSSTPMPDEVWLCSEMHGFLLDNGHGRPLTRYVSWRDSRSTVKSSTESEPFYDRILRDAGGEFLAVTGLVLRPGLPFTSLAYLAKHQGIPPGARYLSLPEWIAVANGEYNGVVHVSMGAGSGLYDVEERVWSKDLLRIVGQAALDLRLPSCSYSDAVVIGAVPIGSKRVPLIGGFGDMQAAIFGAGVPDVSLAAINLGTGSQVAVFAEKPSLQNERRPFFQNKVLSVVTHIPSGRALNVFAKLYDEIAATAGGSYGHFWRIFSDLTVEDILCAPFAVNLGVFPGAWHSAGGGSVSKIMEGQTTPKTLVASLAKGWLCQYADALDILDETHQQKSFALAGGLVRRCGAITAVLETMTGRRAIPSKSESEMEETVLGLLRLAQRP